MTHRHYILFVDESGNFAETSSNRRERKKGQFASQCVGILVPSGHTNNFDTNHKDIIRNRNHYNGKAKDILLGVFNQHNLGISVDTLHGVDLKKGPQYEAYVGAILSALQNKDWRIVRLCNQKQIAFGTRVHNYLSMMAELLFQLFKLLSPNQSTPVFIELIFDNWRKDVTNQVYMQADEYEAFFRQIFQHLCLHAGLDAQHPNWKWSKPRTENAQHNHGLQLADLMSDATKDRFSKIRNNRALVKKFQQFMPRGEYDIELFEQPLRTRISTLLQEGSYGVALQTLTDALLDITDKDGFLLEPEGMLLEQRDSCINALQLMTPIARDSQLQVLQSWLYYTVQVERDQALAQHRSVVIKKHIYEPLQDQIPPKTLNSFLLWMYWLDLTSFNHSGKLLEAHALWSDFQLILRRFSGEYELSHTLVDVLIARAVHMNDCLDLEEAAESMQRVSDHFHDVGEFMSLLHDQDVPQIRSFIRAQALGTWLQTMILQCAQGACRYEEAVVISDKAIDEFSSDADKKRQYQYRSQLEIVAGHGREAAEWLAKSLDCTDYRDIAKKIHQLPVSYQGFPLMHWMRIGAFSTDFRIEWLELTNQAQLWSCDYLNPSKNVSGYPVQSILRYAVSARALEGNLKAAKRYQERLQSLCGDGIAMNILHLCAQIDCDIDVENSIRHLQSRLEKGFEPRSTGLQRWLKALLEASGAERKKLSRYYIL